MDRRTRFYEVAHRPGAAGRTLPNPNDGKRWAQRCPLWQWRIATRTTRETAGQFLGVSDRTVSRWEHGLSQPTSAHMVLLVRLIGPDVEEEWAAWMSRRPQVPAPLLRPEAERMLGIAEVASAAEETARQLAELAALYGDDDR